MPKCLKTEGFRHFLVPEFKFLPKGQTFGSHRGNFGGILRPGKMKKYRVSGVVFLHPTTRDYDDNQSGFFS